MSQLTFWQLSFGQAQVWAELCACYCGSQEDYACILSAVSEQKCLCYQHMTDVRNTGIVYSGKSELVCKKVEQKVAKQVFKMEFVISTVAHKWLAGLT